MKIFSDERLISLGIVSGTVSRHTGSGREKENVKALFEKLDIDPSKILGLHQVHGTDIVKIVTDKDLQEYNKTQTHNADAWLLGREDTGVLILTADCVPLFVWDDKGSFVGLAHCGWRGVAGGLPSKITQAVKEAGAKDAKINAFIGPHINSCCFEVKEDVSSQFSKEAVIEREGKLFVDLTKEIILQLTKEGLKEEDIKHGCACQCTCCNGEDFFSYRRDHTKDVLMSFAFKL